MLLIAFVYLIGVVYIWPLYAVLGGGDLVHDAADRLGLRPSTLRNRMRKLNIQRPLARGSSPGSDPQAPQGSRTRPAGRQ